MGGSASWRISSCNIIKNEQKDVNMHGIIRSDGNLEVKDSCILENIANYMFSQGSSSCTITVTNCTLDDDIYSKKGSNVTITNRAKKAFQVKLNHLNTGKCEGKEVPYFVSNRHHYIQRKKGIKHAAFLSLVICLHQSK